MEINLRQNCPVARGANIVGDKWTLLILRNLLWDGSQRYQDFINGLEGISPTTLSKRLKSLQNDGLVLRQIIDGHPPRTLYKLTEIGLRAGPVIVAISEFGALIPPAE